MKALPERGAPGVWTPTPLKGLSFDFRGLAPSLLKAARRLVGADDAEDLVQDVLLAYIGLVGQGRVENEEERRTTLFGMVKHRAFERRRGGKRRRKLSALITGSTLVAQRPRRADLALDDGRVRHQVNEAILQLPKRWRETFVLMYEDGLAAEAAAEVLGIGQRTARANYGHACRLLRRHLKEAGIDQRLLRGGDSDEAA